jgi:hypothetical protein
MTVNGFDEAPRSVPALRRASSRACHWKMRSQAGVRLLAISLLTRAEIFLGG